MSLIALFTLYVWSTKSPRIDTFGDYFFIRYYKHFDRRFSNAIDTLKVNEDKGIAMLEKLMSDLESIQKLDCLDHIKREGMKMLSGIFEKRSNLDGAMKWADKWVDFDDKDLYGQVHKARLMCQIADSRNAGKQLLANLYQKVPEAKVVVNAYSQMQIADGNSGEALWAQLRLLNFQKRLMSQKWEIYWTFSDVFTPEDSRKVIPSVDNNSILSLVFDVPQGIRKMRLDIPPSAEFLMSYPTLTIKNGEDFTELELWKFNLKMYDILQNNHILEVIQGEDSYFYWEMPERTIEASGSFIFKTNVFHKINKVLLQLYTSESIRSLKREIADRGDAEIADIFSNIKPDILANSSVDIYWSYQQNVFSEVRKNSVLLSGRRNLNRLIFDVNLPLNDKVSELRIDFPDVVDTQYTLEKIEYVIENELYEIDASQAVLVSNHNLKKQGNRFVVIGQDPYFSFKLPEGQSYITSVRLKGLAQ